MYVANRNIGGESKCLNVRHTFNALKVIMPYYTYAHGELSRLWFLYSTVILFAGLAVYFYFDKKYSRVSKQDIRWVIITCMFMALFLYLAIISK